MLRRLGEDLHRRTGRSAGNGSLMRTVPVALAYPGDPEAMIRAARAVSALTHHDPTAGDACALWCLAIDHAIHTGDLDATVGLSAVASARGSTAGNRAADGLTGEDWAARLAEAEAKPPSAFAPASGWVVAALPGAWLAEVDRRRPDRPGPPLRDRRPRTLHVTGRPSSSAGQKWEIRAFSLNPW